MQTLVPWPSLGGQCNVTPCPCTVFITHDKACQPPSRPAFVAGQLKTVDIQRAWKKTHDGDTTPGSSGGVTTRMNREELQGSSDIKADTPTVSRFQWLSISDLSLHNTASYLIRVIRHCAWEEPSCYSTKDIHEQASLEQYAWYNNKKYVWNTCTYPYRNVGKRRATLHIKHSCSTWRPLPALTYWFATADGKPNGERNQQHCMTSHAGNTKASLTFKMSRGFTVHVLK
jgi:hypothetical protein